MAENTTKVLVRNLCKSFGELEVLKDCNFQIEKGEFVCVVGPTGCGKTTFLNLLTCLIEPTSGEILVDGEKADPRKHNLAFVFHGKREFGLFSKNEETSEELYSNPSSGNCKADGIGK